MKRYLYKFTAVVVVAFTLGCTTDLVDDNPSVVPAGDIEITCSFDGEECADIRTSPQEKILTVNVTINNPGIYWTPVSNKDWCRIVEEKHYGNGSFKLHIAANNSFYLRDEAVITFVAGEYSEQILTVTQDGNIFLVDKEYAAMTKEASTFSFTLSTAYEYEFETSDWITTSVAAKRTETDSEGMNYDVMTIEAQIEENTSDSRYGYLNIKRKGEDEVYESLNFWQFGTEVAYDEEGNILIDAQNAKPLEICFPTGLVMNVSCPDWATVTTENDDERTSYIFACEDNPSDASYVRDLSPLFSFFGDTELNLSFIKQNYYDVGGIISSRGLALLARTYNEGGDCDRWKTDGKLLILNDIDMSDIEDWTPIGTASRPFVGEFDGGHKAIMNFKSSKPFFGYCGEDAIDGTAAISNFLFDSSCELTLSGNVATDQYIASLAQSITNTTVSDCMSNASISLDGLTATAKINVYVGGLVALSDATSKIEKSKFSGTITNKDNTALSTTSTSRGVAYVGGIVAHTSGVVEDSAFEFAANISHASIIKDSYIGGIAGYADTASLLKNNEMKGNISYSSLRQPNGYVLDSSRNCYVGGISGSAKGVVEACTFSGRLNSDSNVKSIFIGGIIGYLDSATANLTNNNTSKSSSIAVTGATRYVNAGSLIGGLEFGNYTFDFTNDTGLIEGTILAGSESDGNNKVSSLFVGGLIGGFKNGTGTASIEIVAPKWDGKIVIDFTPSVTWSNVAVGGILGSAGESAETLTAIYKVNISKAKNNGTIEVDTTTGSVIKSPVFIGGILGWNYGGSTISNSTMTGSINWLSTSGKSNGYAVVVGGIVGGVDNGDTTISDCKVENVEMYSGSYNNNGQNTGDFATNKYTFNFTGGIIGTYRYKKDATSGELTITKCSCSGNLNAYRGGVGGIAGCVVDAVISDCQFSGKMEYIKDKAHNCFYGGIVAWGRSSGISGCKVLSDMNGRFAGSINTCSGGIAGWLSSGSVVENCRYFGTVDVAQLRIETTEEHRDEFYGGLAGNAESGTIVRNSKWGGFLRSERINSDALASQYALGVGTITNEPCGGTATNITYWDGNE